MATIWKIPLTPRAQKLRVDIGGIVYTLHFAFNRVNSTWIMNVGDLNDKRLLTGIPIVTGTDLFGQFRYLGIGGGLPLIAVTIGLGHSPDEIPTFDNLGIDSQLFFKTPV